MRRPLVQHKIGLYIRVSTEEQAQVIEGSLETQKHRMLGFIDIKNMQDAGWGKVIESYIDDGFSAKDTRRPAFQRMMRDLKAGKINLILVTDLSRLSRNILDFCILLEDLKKFSAKFLSLKEQFDTSTPAGEMMVFNMINLAQFERKQTAERVAMNFHARALRGLRNGGGVILGYDPDPNDPSKYIVNGAEASQVKTIFKIYREECSLQQTINRLDKEGIVPKAHLKRKDRHNLAGRWTTASLSNVLRNFSYAGLREVNAKNKNKKQESLRAYEKYKIVRAAWEPIIDIESFNYVQKIMDENLSKERMRRSVATARTFFLSGIIYCEECGRPLVGSSGHGKGGVHRYYIHRKIPGEPVQCKIKTIQAQKVEDQVFNHLKEVIFRSGYMESLESRIDYVYRHTAQGSKVELRKHQSDLAQVEKQIRSTIKLIAEMDEDGMESVLKESLKEFKDKKIAIQNRIDELVATEENYRSSQEARAVIELNAMELNKAFAKSTPAKIKRLLQKVLAMVVIPSNGIAKIAYWEESDKNEKKPKNKKGLENHSSPSLNLKNRHRIVSKIADLESAPTLPFVSGDKGFVSGYIVKNGRRGGI